MTTDEELAKLSKRVRALERKLERSERARVSLELLRDKSQALLMTVNRELAATLESLEVAQNELVLREKMASLGRLVAGLAHEMNTPIGAIRSAADSATLCADKVTARVGDDDPRVKRTLEVLKKNGDIIRDASQRLASLVDHLRHFAHLDEAGLQKADLHAGIDSTLALLEHELSDRVAVHRSYGAVPPVYCHAAEVNQVFMNLLLNAAQAIEGSGDVYVDTWSDDAHAFVTIRDTGRGMPQDVIAQVFDPGMTTKGVGVGVGLGLSISYGVILRHHGELRVESTPGAGSKFTVVLPLDLEQRLSDGDDVPLSQPVASVRRPG